MCEDLLRGTSHGTVYRSLGISELHKSQVITEGEADRESWADRKGGALSEGMGSRVDRTNRSFHGSSGMSDFYTSTRATFYTLAF